MKRMIERFILIACLEFINLTFFPHFYQMRMMRNWYMEHKIIVKLLKGLFIYLLLILNFISAFMFFVHLFRWEMDIIWNRWLLWNSWKVHLSIYCSSWILYQLSCFCPPFQMRNRYMEQMIVVKLLKGSFIDLLLVLNFISAFMFFVHIFRWEWRGIDGGVEEWIHLSGQYGQTS